MLLIYRIIMSNSSKSGDCTHIWYQQFREFIVPFILTTQNNNNFGFNDVYCFCVCTNE